MEQTDSRNARTFDRRLPTEGELLAALVRRSMFWTPERAAPSAWIEHVPFAFWLVDVLRPRTIVELGTSTGVSYSAFCQAVKFLQLPTSCIAVDTWKGDEHVGLYSEDVYREFESFHNRRYGAFSRLVKSTFDQAVRHFDDGSVDLLHIDGVHTYEAVRHDYESWLPKLSADGVVLFHDTNVRENGFGVFRLWSEIIDSHSHFSFLHGHGLGILGIGDRYSHELRCLFDASNSDLLNSAVRDIFFSLGRSVRVVSEQTALDGTLAEQQARITGLTEAISERNLQIKELVNAIETREAQIASSEQTLDTTRTELKHSNLQIAELGALLGDQETKLNSREAAVRALYASHSWQITAPLRAAGALMKMFYHSRFGYPLVLAHCALKARSLAPLREWRAVAAIRHSDLFDAGWYLRTYSDVATRGVDPVRHYVVAGAREGRDPSLFFSTRGYLHHHPDVAAAGINPLLHFILYGDAAGRMGGSAKRSRSQPTTGYPHSSGATAATTDEPGLPPRRSERNTDSSPESYLLRETLAADCKLLRDSGLVNQKAYRVVARIGSKADPVAHYLVSGWKRDLDPGPGFHGKELYPYYCSVGFSGPPAITYLNLRAAGAPAYATLAEAERWAAPIRRSKLFDAARYAARINHMEGLDPALHYVILGENMGFAPSDAFDPGYYRRRYLDITGSSVSALGHYLVRGRQEGRRPTSGTDKFPMDGTRIDHRRETVLLISHEASRTGAPIIAWNIAMRLRHRYNVVALLIGSGELVASFEDCCAAVVGPICYADPHPVESEYIVRRLLATYPIAYAIANSAESRRFVPALAAAFVPVVSLIHEFASYTRPKESMAEGLDWSTQIVFSTETTVNSARAEHPHLAKRSIHVLPQGRCEIPRAPGQASFITQQALDRIFRPSGWEDALVVLGAGYIHIRKGVELFVACAAAVSAMKPKRPVRFIWIGGGYDPVNGIDYSTYLAEQIARSGVDFRGHDHQSVGRPGSRLRA